MAHDLFRDHMAYVGAVPWHGLGVQVPEGIGAEDMCRAANLDWTVEKVPAPGARPLPGKEDAFDRYLVMRARQPDEDADVALGIVGSGYEPLQNTDAFKFFEPFIDNKIATLHTAGALGRGGKVWVLARLADQIVAKDDVVDRFLLLSNSHDGSGAVSVRFTPIRVVCQNTLTYAMKKSTGVISIRHTRHVARHLANAQAEQLKAVVDKAFAEAGTLFGRMAALRMTARTADTFLESLFPRTDNQKAKGLEPERWTRIKAILADQSVTPRKTADTLWALYNAVIRDEDYRESRESTADARLGRIWFGSGYDLKLKTLNACRTALKAAA